MGPGSFNLCAACVDPEQGYTPILGCFRIAIPVHVCDYLLLTHVPLYTPSHVGANPISLTCFICLGLGNAFVKMSRSSPHKTCCMATKQRGNWAWPVW